MAAKRSLLVISFNPDKLTIVPIDQVRPNSWNPKPKRGTNYDKIKKSIETHGQKIYPIVVRQNNGYEIVDGEQRYTACLDLGFDEILIYNEGKLTDQEAQALTIWYQQQAPFDSLAEAALAYNLHVDYKIELPYSEDQLDDFSKLATFSFADYNPNPDNKNDDTEIKTLSLTMHKDKYDVIISTLDHLIESNQASDRAQALEFICADFQAGA